MPEPYTTHLPYFRKIQYEAVGEELAPDSAGPRAI